MSNKKRIYLNLFMICFYFIYQFIPILFISIFKINMNENFSKQIFYIISNLIYLIIVLFIYKKELKNDITKINLKNFLKYIPIYLLGIYIMNVSNNLISLITNSNISQNEINVRESIKLFPIYMTFSILIYAPFVEEIIFRKTFRNIINNKYIFIIISGILFGLIHMTFNNNLLNEFLMIIPYILMGITFSYIYYKSDNIFTTIIFHSLHNLILLIQFFGGLK